MYESDVRLFRRICYNLFFMVADINQRRLSSSHKGIGVDDIAGATRQLTLFSSAAKQKGAGAGSSPEVLSKVTKSWLQIIWSWSMMNDHCLPSAWSLNIDIKARITSLQEKRLLEFHDPQEVIEIRLAQLHDRRELQIISSEMDRQPASGGFVSVPKARNRVHSSLRRLLWLPFLSLYLN